MLDVLRTSSQTWYGRIIMTVVMGFLIIAFGFWGIADIFRGFGANTLARVGSVEITPEAFRNAFQTQLIQLQERERKPISAQEAHERGLDRQVLSRLLSNAALDLEAHRLGLAIPNKTIAKEIMQDQSFKGPDGQFNRQMFEERLQDNGLSEHQYVAETRAGAMRHDIVSVLTSGLAAPHAMMEIINRYYNEKRNIDYIDLPKTAAGTIPAPTAAQLKTYFDAHSALYRQPEYRKISLLVVNPQTLAEALAAKHPITDAEIKKSYEAVKDQRYTEPEKRKVQQIIFPDEKSANAAEAKLKGGESFAALIAERKLKPTDTDLGTVTRSGLADKAVAAAAFTIPSGSVSAPVKTQFGWAIVHAVTTMPKVVIPLIAVKGTIAHDLAMARAKKDLQKVHDAIEDQRASGKSVADAAKAVGLKAQVIAAIDAQGDNKDGKPVSGIGSDPQAVLKAVFASDVGVDNDPVETQDGGAVWFDVLNVDPARDRTLDEVKARVIKDWTADQTSQRLIDKTIDLTKKLDSGATLASIAAAQGNLPVKHVDKITRMTSQGLSNDLLNEVFNRPVGKAGSGAAQNGRILFKVTSASVPPLNSKHFEFRNVVSQMKTALDDDMTSRFITLLEDRLGARINPQVWQSVSGTAADQ